MDNAALPYKLGWLHAKHGYPLEDTHFDPRVVTPRERDEWIAGYHAHEARRRFHGGSAPDAETESPPHIQVTA